MSNLSMLEDAEFAPVNVGEFEPVPKGKYLAQIVESEVKENSKGTGIICKTVHEILDAAYAGRKIFSQFNVAHENPKAQQIGRGMFSSCAKACGLTAFPTDSSELHLAPHIVNVDVEESAGYAPKNVIKAFYPKPIVATPEPPVGEDDLPDFLR